MNRQHSDNIAPESHLLLMAGWHYSAPVWTILEIGPDTDWETIPVAEFTTREAAVAMVAELESIR